MGWFRIFRRTPEPTCPVNHNHPMCPFVVIDRNDNRFAGHCTRCVDRWDLPVI